MDLLISLLHLSDPVALLEDRLERLFILRPRQNLLKVVLLFRGGELGIPLVNDEVGEGVAHILGWDLQKTIPLFLPCEFPKLHLRNGGVFIDRFESVVLYQRAVKTNIFLPFSKEIGLIIEGCHFFH